MSDGKVCSRCQEWRPVDAFNRNASKPLGRNSECKTCQAERDRARLQVVRERAQAVELAPDHSKQCRRCGEWQPAANYCRDVTKADGLNAYCKACRSGYHQLYQHGKGRDSSAAYFLASAARAGRLVRPSYPYLTDSARMCMTCREWQPLDCFHAHKGKIGGINSQCKRCMQAYAADYNQQNQDARRRADALYRAHNRDRRRASYRAWSQRNRGHVRAKHQEWSRHNRDKIRAVQHRRRARILGNGGSYTAGQWRTLVEWFGGVCLCCAATGPLTADHVIPVSKGGTSWISNMQPLCFSCNSSKSDRHSTDYRDPDQLRAFLAHIN